MTLTVLSFISQVSLNGETHADFQSSSSWDSLSVAHALLTVISS